jgi:hypothetical protein
MSTAENPPLKVIGDTEKMIYDQLCEHTFNLDDLFYRQLALDKNRTKNYIGIGQKISSVMAFLTTSSTTKSKL